MRTSPSFWQKFPFLKEISSPPQKLGQGNFRSVVVIKAGPVVGLASTKAHLSWTMRTSFPIQPPISPPSSTVGSTQTASMGNTGLPSHPPSVPVPHHTIGPSTTTRARPGGLVQHHNVERSMLPHHLLYEDNVGDQCLSRELPMVRSTLMQLTHLMHDSAHLEDYHARVHRQMSQQQRAWLAERVPQIGEGTYSCWDGVW